MKQLNSTIEDTRVILIIVFMLMILGSVFGAIRESTNNEQTQAMVDDIEQSSVSSFMIILFGIGMLGTIGLVVTLISVFQKNFGGAIWYYVAL